MKKSGIYILILGILLAFSVFVYIQNGDTPTRAQIVERDNVIFNPIYEDDLILLRGKNNELAAFIRIEQVLGNDSLIVERGNITAEESNNKWGWINQILSDKHQPIGRLETMAEKDLRGINGNYYFYRKSFVAGKIPLFERLLEALVKFLFSFGTFALVLIVAITIWMGEGLRDFLSNQFKNVSSFNIWLFIAVGATLFKEFIQYYGYLTYLETYDVSASGLWLPTLVNAFVVSVPVFMIFHYVMNRWGSKEFLKAEILKFPLLVISGILFSIIGYVLAEGVSYVFDFPATQFIYRNDMHVGWKIPDFKEFWLFFAGANFLNNLRKHFVDLRKKEKQLVVTEKKALTHESELNALQARVNPHFLYNALNSLASLAQVDPAKTEEMALALSDFYKHSTNRQDEHMSSLKEEIELLKNYLKIEKIRFRERLNYDIEVEESLHNIKIPRFLIQPLVENAIKYGYNKESNSIQIKIKASKEDTLLEINIYDTGKPFSGDLATGYGLRSVKKKLKLLYPDAHELQFINEPEKHVNIQLETSKSPNNV